MNTFLERIKKPKQTTEQIVESLPSYTRVQYLEIEKNLGDNYINQLILLHTSIHYAILIIRHMVIHLNQSREDINEVGFSIEGGLCIQRFFTNYIEEPWIRELLSAIIEQFYEELSEQIPSIIYPLIEILPELEIVRQDIDKKIGEAANSSFMPKLKRRRK